MRKIIAALALLIAANAHAQDNRIFIGGSKAGYPLGSTCAQFEVNTLDSSYKTVSCESDIFVSTNPVFVLPGYYPPGVSSSWTARIHYETPDTGTNKICSWTVTAIAYPNASLRDPDYDDFVEVASSAVTHAANRKYKSGTAVVPIINAATLEACTGAACDDSEIKFFVGLYSAASTASICRLSGLELRF